MILTAMKDKAKQQQQIEASEPDENTEEQLYEISVKTGEELKLDVLLSNADKVQHQSRRSTGWRDDWSRTDGVQSELITIRDRNLIINEFTPRDAGSYRVLDPEGEILITVTVRGFFPEIWNQGLISPIHKNGDKLEPNNYRGICVNSNLGKILMHYWQPVTSAPCLWSVRNAPWDIWFPLICFILHFLCWAIICSILLIFDYPELLGIKQVYYECLGLGDPLLLKSERAQRLYAHLRHPVCVELLTVLWLLPTFPLDRLLLAVYLSVYLILAHSLDTQDCTYLRRQLRSKLQLFSAPLEGSDQRNNTHKTD
ncbi:nurim-like [Sinocyclocheilus anshuiensis]|uniref:nurim-like n=1 Tax=Sinocyclocheilus anshuiensis TaxID=1608454 RepID=UPI0007B84D54|nr:PREDICTED: nurim-like [Sinocyclocheilus anshuiensis]